MTRRLARIAACFAILFAATGARDPILVPEISQHEVVVRQGFTGADLLLFGAILEPDGTRPQGDDAYDIVVVLKGPTEAITLREKQRRWGMWVNAESVGFRSAPSFYALTSSDPIAQIVDDKTAAIYELGLDYLQLSPIGSIDTDEQRRFSGGLVEKRVLSGLYRQDEDGVRISEGVLYQARIAMPSNVVTGLYTAETFAISRGRVVATATSEVSVEKRGFERGIEVFSRTRSFLYGLFAVTLSILMGWLAGRFFAQR